MNRAQQDPASRRQVLELELNKDAHGRVRYLRISVGWVIVASVLLIVTTLSDGSGARWIEALKWAVTLR